MPTHNEIMTAWRSLSSNGTPPSPEVSAKVLPEWSVGIDDWQDRLVNTYLRDFCVGGEEGSRGNSHFKLVIAGYGGGKTHFLHAFRHRALEEGFAVCYIQCKKDEVSFDDWMGLYSMIAQSIRLPGVDGQGIAKIVETARDNIASRTSSAPNADAAFNAILEDLQWLDYPSTVFLDVMTKAIRLRNDRQDPQLYRVAVTWLQDGQRKTGPEDMKKLGVAKLAQKQLSAFGREMFYSLVRFVTEFGGAKGLVLLMDEMDTMFSAKGKALERLLAALRTTIDQSDDRIDSIPVFGLFAAVPEINGQMQTNYAALYQRFSVIVPFHEGNDNAAQINLEQLSEPRKLLAAIGLKLVNLASLALRHEFNRDLQRRNVETLVEVAEERVFANVDSRRLFVKTWCAFLDEQHRKGEQLYDAVDINKAFQGTYQGIKDEEENDTEDDG
ncbi:MAG: DUF2791 family P-loop domain-containing protein [Verrucomicrobia bacterium]|nr:DUF2791 family P-loop domain-containing protein [Verrucomicrobiota bacterium]